VLQPAAVGLDDRARQPEPVPAGARRAHTFAKRVDRRIDARAVVAYVDHREVSDGVIALPSSGAQAAIAIINLPDDAFSTSVNDLDYAVRVVSVGPDGLTLATDPPNRFFTAQFTRCEGAALPTAGDFTCKVENATLVEGTDVTTQTTCAVRLP
jgi:hypothetical protein